MKKQFYLATRKDREAQANTISEALKARGWERTFEWGAQDCEGTDECARVAEQELNAIRKADVLMVCPSRYVNVKL